MKYNLTDGVYIYDEEKKLKRIYDKGIIIDNYITPFHYDE